MKALLKGSAAAVASLFVLGCGGGSSDGGSAPDGGSVNPTAPRACVVGAGSAGRTFVLEVGEISSSLRTDAARPASAEVYCLRGKGNVDRGSIVMLPGLGLSHYIYLTTPDGRPGWASHFAHAGFTVYVVNPSANVTNPGDPSADPALRSWDPAEIWARWGFGSAAGVPYPDTRFPTGSIQHFNSHMPLYSGTGGQSATNELNELLDRIGPTVLVLHSASGPAGFAVASARPRDITAIVAVEPTGCPVVAAETPATAMLAVYGDYIVSRNQTSRLQACTTTVANTKTAGRRGDLFSYPDRGIRGNTHLLMQDNNNGQIATDISNWLR
jgi:pimeloyl-ACP methyl ester carboxylesterase